MSKQRTGNFIAGGNPQVPSLTLNNGVFDSNEVYTAVNNNAWQPSGSGTYEIARSLRFRRVATAFLSRTASVAGNRRTWTWSGWVKRGAVGVAQTFFDAYSGDENNNTEIYIGSDDKLAFSNVISGTQGNGFYGVTAAVFRDPNAWYHLVFSVDTTKSTVQNALKVYVNGIQQAITGSYGGGVNQNTWVNSATTHRLGHTAPPNGNVFDGYMTEVNFIDGQALDPSYFGYFDNLGIWQPKRYAGSYGTNGYYFAFTDNQTTLNLGRNFAGSNLIQYSQTLDQTGAGAWAGGAASVSANSATAPDGTTTADKVVENSVANSQHYLLGNGNPTTSSFQNCRLTLSVYAKAAGRNFFQLALTDSVIAATGVVFDLANGLLCERSGDSTAFTNTQGTITAVGNGWYRCTMTTTKGSLNGNAQPVFYLASGTTAGSTNYNGDGTSGVLFWGAQLNFGETADNYIATTSSAANTNWTVNNFSLTAGVTYDSMVDSPTNVFTTVNDTGGVVPGNCATLNILTGSTEVTYANGNLTVTGGPSNNFGASYSSIGVTAGKWYAEFTIGSLGSNGNSLQFGVSSYIYPRNNSNMNGTETGNTIVNIDNALSAFRAISVNGTTLSGGDSGFTFSVNDVVGIALNADAGQVTFYKNGTVLGTGYPYTATLVSGSSYYFLALTRNNGSASSCSVNFGQRPFAYTPPAGYKSLNTTNLQALGSAATARAGLEPSKWFDVVLSAGNTTGRTVSGLKFQPDLVVFKNRDGTGNRRWSWFDSVRGPNNHLTSQLSDAEVTGRSDLLTSFNSDGFNVGADAAYYGTNGFNERWSHWAWKAGNDTVTNTSGSVSTQVRTSATSGFSIATYTPPSSGSFTFGHGLPSAPQFIILKERTSNGNWIVWHPIFGSPTNQGFYLNSSISPFAAGANWLTGITSTTVGITQGQVTSGANPHIVYSFIEIPGFSKIGSFVGNGSTDGPFVYCGFRPRFIMARAFTNGAFWVIHDTQRDLTNPSTRHLYPHTSNAEEQLYSTFDILSNGFKCRNAADNVNYSGTNAIFIAFAESPFALNNRAR